MPRTRRQTQAPTEPKEPKYTAVEKLPDNRKRKRRPTEAKAKKTEPVRISKYYYDKAVAKIHNHLSKKKKKHPLIELHGCSGTRALNNCHLFSLNTLNRSLVQPANYARTLNHLSQALRRAMLARNWSYCLELCGAYLGHGALRQRHLPYLFKVIFFLMLNVSAERLHDFLNVTLSMRKAASQEAYLWSLIELKEFSSESRKTAEKDRSASAAEESDPDILPADEEVVSCDDDASDSA